MKDLLTTEFISCDALDRIFNNVSEHNNTLENYGAAACSFQGAGVRTRTTFIQSLNHLGLSYIDLPVFLDTAERVQDLAGYLDQYYDLYIIRYSNHEKLAEFAEHSQRPVINAMSSMEHPCEAIADAYWFTTRVRPLKDARIVLWGPATNVLRSWRNVAATAGAELLVLNSPDVLPGSVDLVVTDGWPDGESSSPGKGLELTHLEKMGSPALLPTPPFTIGRELLFDPLRYPGFAGYEQKGCLVDVQKAIIRYVLSGPGGRGYC